MEQISNVELLSNITGEKNLDKIQKLLQYESKDPRLRPLANLTMEEIVEYTSLTPRQANCVVSSIELGKRLASEYSDKKIRVNTPEDIASLFMEELRYEKQEHFQILMLNTKNEIMSKELVSIGNINSSIVDPREVFSKAIKKNAASIALVHNHPSGNPEPSDADINVTSRLCKAGEILDVKIIDHIIIGDGTYISFRRKKLLDISDPSVDRVHDDKKPNRDGR